MADQAQARAPELPPVLGPGLALFGYTCLMVGFLAIGFSTQARNPVVGLWLTEALAIALPALIAFRGANVRPAPFVGLWRVGALALAVAAAVAILNQPIVSLLEWFAHRYGPADWIRQFDAKNALLEQLFAGRKLGMVVTVTLAAPLGEELFFRGFALPAMARRWGPGVAIVVTGGLFALLHLDPIGFIGLWELGIVFGLLRWATGSIWPSVLAHAVNNGLAAGAFLLGMQKPEEDPPAWLLALGGVFLLGSIPLAVKLISRPTPVAVREEPWTNRDLRRGFKPGRTAGLIALWSLAVVIGLGLIGAQLAAAPRG